MNAKLKVHAIMRIFKMAKELGSISGEETGGRILLAHIDDSSQKLPDCPYCYMHWAPSVDGFEAVHHSKCPTYRTEQSE